MENIIKRRLTSVSSLKTLLVAALILFACHNIHAGDAYDSDSRASEDLGYFAPVSDSSNEFPTLQNLKANNEKCSETCAPTITFENKGCRTVEIYLYHSGHFTHYKTLAPGGVHEQPADKYDIWAVYTSSGNYLGCYYTGCYDDHVNIHSGGSIHVNAGHNRFICKGESVQLCATGADHYQWSNGQTGACITVSPHQNTNYSVTGTSNGCSDTDHVSVHVDEAEWDHVNKGQDADCDNCNGSIIVDGNYNATGKIRKVLLRHLMTSLSIIYVRVFTLILR